MNEDKKLVVILLIGFVILIFLLTTLWGCMLQPPKTEVAMAEPKMDISDKIYTEEDRLTDLAKSDGYDNFITWAEDLQQLKNDISGSATAAEEIYTDYLSPEQIAFLYEYEEHMLNSETIAEFNKWKEWYDQIIAIGEETKEAMETAYIEGNYYDYNYDYYNYSYDDSSYDVPDSGLTAYSGVNYYDGRTETYYSSNVAYHYRTNEWYVDSEGFYRTDEGYYVVAASDMEQGTTFEGSKGTCIVLDSGCSEGVTDYYVNW